MRFHGKEAGMKLELRVWTLAIIGGLSALLMLAAVACNDPDPNATGDPTVTPLAPTGTTTPTPPNAPPPTDPPTPMPTDTPTPAPTNTLTPTPSAGICERTEQVRDAILDRIDGVDGCKAVTAAHLSTIDGEMVLAGMDIGELQAGDFDGLTTLDVLDVRGSAASPP